MNSNRYFFYAHKGLSVYSGVHMECFSVFGDSVFKGVRYDSASGKTVVNDRLGLDAAAREAGLTLKNFSKFGCTITKAWNYVQKMFTRIDSDIVLMNFGGNDCNYNWEAISERPSDVHLPNTSLDEFVETYNNMIDYVMERRSLPVLATLLPVQDKTYIDYVCASRGLDRNNVMKWVNSRSQSLSDHQKEYSDAVVAVAADRGIPLIDLRSAFNSKGRAASLLGPDGIHPNDRGQKVMRGCFQAFIGDYLAI